MCWWQMRILAKTTQQKKKQRLFKGGFPGGTVIKNLLPKAGEQETVQSLGWEDPLEEEMATHSSILAWRILDRAAWRATVHRVAKSQT